MIFLPLIHDKVKVWLPVWVPQYMANVKITNEYVILAPAASSLPSLKMDSKLSRKNPIATATLLGAHLIGCTPASSAWPAVVSCCATGDR
jgi:hypothetical protein